MYKSIDIRFMFKAFLVGTLLMSATAGQARDRLLQIGIGANYWYSLEDAVDEKFDRDGLGWMISARLFPDSLLHLGLELERSPKNFVELEKELYAPAAFLVLGQTIYGALGAGMYYYDGTFYKDLFYVMRAGLCLELLPALYLDINANYRFDKFREIDDAFSDIDTDNVTLGAAVRIGF